MGASFLKQWDTKPNYQSDPLTPIVDQLSGIKTTSGPGAQSAPPALAATGAAAPGANPATPFSGATSAGALIGGSTVGRSLLG